MRLPFRHADSEHINDNVSIINVIPNVVKRRISTE